MNKPNRIGFTLVEIILAMAILAIVVTLLTPVFVSGFTQLILSGNRSQSVKELAGEAEFVFAGDKSKISDDLDEIEMPLFVDGSKSVNVSAKKIVLSGGTRLGEVDIDVYKNNPIEPYPMPLNFQPIDIFLSDWEDGNQIGYLEFGADYESYYIGNAEYRVSDEYGMFADETSFILLDQAYIDTNKDDALYIESGIIRIPIPLMTTTNFYANFIVEFREIDNHVNRLTIVIPPAPKLKVVDFGKNNNPQYGVQIEKAQIADDGIVIYSYTSVTEADRLVYWDHDNNERRPITSSEQLLGTDEASVRTYDFQTIESVNRGNSRFSESFIAKPYE